MNKYIVTILVNGVEAPVNVRAKDEVQAKSQILKTTSASKILRLETREQYKKRNKPFERVMTSSFQSVTTSKQNPRS